MNASWTHWMDLRYIPLLWTYFEFHGVCSSFCPFWPVGAKKVLFLFSLFQTALSFWKTERIWAGGWWKRVRVDVSVSLCQQPSRACTAKEKKQNLQKLKSFEFRILMDLSSSDEIPFVFIKLQGHSWRAHFIWLIVSFIKQFSINYMIFYK